MIYVFLANGFEEVEALAPVDMLRRAKQEVTTVGVTGKIVTGSHHIPVTADITAEELQIGGDMDMIVLPGGMPGTLNEEASPVVQAAIDYCVANDRWIGAICAAPSILGHKAPAPKPEELGFIRRVDALISGRKYMKNPDRKQDIQDYVTVIYAYRGEESRFYELYSTYPKVIDKFKLMRPIVEKYEIANGIK